MLIYSEKEKKSTKYSGCVQFVFFKKKERVQDVKLFPALLFSL